jgi:hypothetical protein
MTSLETLNMKIAVNKLSFPLVTHMVYFNTGFGSYRLLKSRYDARHILDILNIQVIDQVLGPEEA